MYLDKIYNILEKRNNNTSQSNLESNETGTGTEREESVWNGVFEYYPNQTLYLFIDFKHNGEDTYEAVHKALEPFRSKGWLTYYNETSNTTYDGPLTVIGTGETPLNKVLEEKLQRDIFYDAPLNNLNETFNAHHNKVSIMASASIKKVMTCNQGISRVATNRGLDDRQLICVLKAINKAHELGLMSRLWDTPDWPLAKEKAVWSQLLALGTDYLNADDIYLASFYDWPEMYRNTVAGAVPLCT
ncbi:unnamed protein product [Ambrosiozyma monospora]|uniref:Unnamed protein product n=1 Tax=Ambrosiozyma monospora TaxID=43982 RepID=A0ACB5U862_AMBMO|nr:unnamed protein product [Ambrosiozyma monospora]